MPVLHSSPRRKRFADVARPIHQHVSVWTRPLGFPIRGRFRKPRLVSSSRAHVVGDLVSSTCPSWRRGTGHVAPSFGGKPGGHVSTTSARVGDVLVTVVPDEDPRRDPYPYPKYRPVDERMWNRGKRKSRRRCCGPWTPEVVDRGFEPLCVRVSTMCCGGRRFVALLAGPVRGKESSSASPGRRSKHRPRTSPKVSPPVPGWKAVLYSMMRRGVPTPWGSRLLRPSDSEGNHAPTVGPALPVSGTSVFSK